MAKAQPITVEGHAYRKLGDFAREVERRFGVPPERVLLWLRSIGLEATLLEARRFFLRHRDRPPPRRHWTRRERWSHPLTGQRVERLFLGACLSGRLRVRLADHSQAVELIWTGRSPSGAFDWYLRSLGAPRRLTANVGE